MEDADAICRKTLETAFHGSLAYLQSLKHGPVAASGDHRSIRATLEKKLPEQGAPPEEVVSDLIRNVPHGLLNSAGGRFFGWVIGGSLPAALAADWLTSAWDQNAAVFATSPVAAVVEEIAGSWLKEILGLPQQASFALVTGCQMAHVTCLAAARHSLLERRGWNVEDQGLWGAPPIRILTSGAQHSSFARAVRVLGFGKAQIAYLASNAEDRLQACALEEALRSDPAAPTIMVLQAGDLNLGTYDAFADLIPIAKRYGAWVHVDGAFGLWAAASPQYRHLLDGVAGADSWAMDGHQWLNVPYDCGYAFVADADAHRASMSGRESYMAYQTEVRDQMDWNPEWSRRARGFSTYAAIRELGRSGIAALINRCCRHAHSLVTQIGSLPCAEMLWEPRINQGLVRFLDPKANASSKDHDRRTDDVIAAIAASGEAFFGGTTWRGKRVMRVSVTNWRTSDEDVERTVRAVERASANDIGNRGQVYREQHTTELIIQGNPAR